MSSKTYNAIVLKNLKFKDSDKIFTLFTKEDGKIYATAKGVRKITSKRGGSLDSLNYIKVQITTHISGINYITEVELIHPFKRVKQNFVLTKEAMYILELISRFTMQDSNTSSIFELLLKTINLLDEKGEGDRLIVNKFEIGLMKYLGYQPPNGLIKAWVEKVKNNERENADYYIKNFVVETLQESIKSLEIL